MMPLFDITTDQIILILGLILPFVAAMFSGFWLRGKKKLKYIRNFVVALDDAMEDDKITDEEFDKIFATGKAILDKND